MRETFFAQINCINQSGEKADRGLTPGLTGCLLCRPQKLLASLDRGALTLALMGGHMPRISAGGGHPLHALTCRPTCTKRSDNRATEKGHEKDGKVGSGERGSA